MAVNSARSVIVRPSFATNTASGAYKAIIASMFPELNRLSRDGITPSGSVGSGKHSDIRRLLFWARRYSMRFANVAVTNRSAGRIFLIVGTYSIHSGRELAATVLTAIRKSTQVAQAATASRRAAAITIVYRLYGER